MKTQRLILSATIFLALLMACQKQEFSNNDNKQNGAVVTTRSECEPCDTMDDCCCFVQLGDDDAATIRICGTTDGMAACSGSTGPCNSGISGGGQTISLNSTTPIKVFCMNAQSGLRIVNTSDSDNAGIRVGCNGTTALPITYNIAPQDSVKAETNMSCELSDCM